MPYAENTKVEVEKTIADIVKMLKAAGAKRIGQQENETDILIYFELADRAIRFRVPLATAYMGPSRHRNGAPVDPRSWLDQKNRQRARALLLVIKAKLESVASEVETFEEAFLANVMGKDGRTVYEAIRDPLAVEYRERPAHLLLGGPA